MSSLSLKEQLQALSLGSSASNEAASKKHHHQKKGPVRNKAVKAKPAWLEQAQYGVELLKAHFPACFKEAKDVQPLKVGIKQDLVKFLSTKEDIVMGDKACMVSSLSYYVNSLAYLKSVVEGAQRIDLEGNSAGTVTADEAKYSVENRQAKLLKKKTAQGAKNKPEQQQPT
jgi:sRNA-binding protein